MPVLKQYKQFTYISEKSGIINENGQEIIFRKRIKNPPQPEDEKARRIFLFDCEEPLYYDVKKYILERQAKINETKEKYKHTKIKMAPQRLIPKSYKWVYKSITGTYTKVSTRTGYYPHLLRAMRASYLVETKGFDVFDLMSARAAHTPPSKAQMTTDHISIVWRLAGDSIASVSKP